MGPTIVIMRHVPTRLVLRPNVYALLCWANSISNLQPQINVSLFLNSVTSQPR